MSHVTRDKVVDEWLAEAELAVQAAEQVVEAARRELQEAEGRLLRLRAATEVTAEADAVVRERASEMPADATMDQAEQAPVPKWRPDADVARLPRDYPKIAQIVPGGRAGGDPGGGGAPAPGLAGH
ncbi:hypothetical protein ACIBJF_51015 [Streptomyces sp. NPDC050743]|uniref:hypothetical protein n=1 Tax=Streptomyces sp. NPDC050743 TaxID=3365634 RepID=UPI00378B837F